MPECLSLLIKGVFGLVLLTGLSISASAQIYFDTHSESKLWLEGSSTVHRFDCVARSIQGTAYVEGYESPEMVRDDTSRPPMSDRDTINGGDRNSGSDSNRHEVAQGDSSLNTRNDAGNVASNLHVHLKIPIRSFDCGRSRMNRDMYEALKSDTYDYITFDFEKAAPLEEDSSRPDSLFTGDYRPYVIEGTLNVAGVDRYVTLTTQGRSEGEGRYRIRGHKEISMHDFDIEPPTALRGLIRAHEELMVYFDLLVQEQLPDS